MTWSWLSKFFCGILAKKNIPCDSDKRNVNELFVSSKCGSRRPLLTTVSLKLYQNIKFSYILNLMMRNFIFLNAQTALTCWYRLIQQNTCLGMSVQWSNGKWNFHLITADLQLKSELSSIPLSPDNHLYLRWYQNSWILAKFSFYVPVFTYRDDWANHSEEFTSSTPLMELAI